MNVGQTKAVEMKDSNLKFWKFGILKIEVPEVNVLELQVPLKIWKFCLKVTFLEMKVLDAPNNKKPTFAYLGISKSVSVQQCCIVTTCVFRLVPDGAEGSGGFQILWKELLFLKGCCIAIGYSVARKFLYVSIKNGKVWPNKTYKSKV